MWRSSVCGPIPGVEDGHVVFAMKQRPGEARWFPLSTAFCMPFLLTDKVTWSAATGEFSGQTLGSMKVAVLAFNVTGLFWNHPARKGGLTLCNKVKCKISSFYYFEEVFNQLAVQCITCESSRMKEHMKC